jgi:hypothetical protein
MKKITIEIKLIKHHALKMYWRSEGRAPSILQREIWLKE